MRSNFAVTSLSIAALVFAAGPAFAQTSADKPTMKQKVEQKADQAGDKAGNERLVDHLQGQDRALLR